MSKLPPNHRKSVAKHSLSGSGFGDIAQLVEQMTFNHWVQGSSPCVPTRNSTTACRSFNFYVYEKKNKLINETQHQQETNS